MSEQKPYQSQTHTYARPRRLMHDGKLQHGGEPVEPHPLGVDAKHGGSYTPRHDGHATEAHATSLAACTKGHACSGHALGEAHGAGCGHEAIPHDAHVDYVVQGRRHHPHEGHCDDHGPI
jgi:hypothetical protein